MAYTNIDLPTDYFNTVLYTGDDANNRQISVNFSPDLTWIKVRNESYGHMWFDRIRGIAFTLSSQTTGASTDRTGIGWTNSGCTTNSFTVDRGTNESLNETGRPFVAWNWLGGGTGVSNTAGTITSTVSANTTSGFSVVSWTGNGSSGATVGHGLGVAPKMTIIKQRNSSNGWNVWAFANNAGDPDSFGELNSTAAWYQDQGADAPYTTQPTSSLLTLTAYGQVNGNTNTYIAYCFAEVKGFSKFGSYTGNGNADGTFVYTGFKPAFVMTKRTDGADWWGMWDSKRLGYNGSNYFLRANTTDVEANKELDILSNGFKIRTIDGGINASGGTYIYMAFAENPFVSSKGIPTTAR